MEYFPAFVGYIDSLAMLTDEQKGRVFMAALLYTRDGVVTDLEPVEAMAFAFIRGDIDRAREKYDDICEKRRDAINKRWQNASDTNEYKSTAEIQKNTSGTKQNKTKQDKTIQNNTNESIPASDDAKPARAKKSGKKSFVPPSVEEVAAYCREKGLSTIDPEYFVSFYSETDWIKANGEPVRNWKSTVLTWAQRDKERGVTAPSRVQDHGSFDTDDFYTAALARSQREMEEIQKGRMKS